MSRIVEVKSPSFPDAKKGTSITSTPNTRWQPLCGDTAHWRAGIYSPSTSNLTQIEELEKHSCPELFLLIEGELTLVLVEDGKLKELKLEKEKPILVDSWHSGYCPNGPFSGKAFIVERDDFVTEYVTVKELTS